MANHYPQKSENLNFSLRNPKGEYPKSSIKKMAVLFTDIVGSSKYFKENGDIAGRKMLKQHQDISSPVIAEFGGFVVKFLGDSVMAYFLDPGEALKAAIKIQQKFQNYNRNKQNRDEIHIRICIHYGDGIEEDKDIFGDVVNMAAKFLPLVEGGQIYVSQELRNQVIAIPSVKYNRVQIPNSIRLPGNINLFNVTWDEDTDFDPIIKTLLLFKPVWTINKKHFKKTWNSFLNHRKALCDYSGIDKESVLADKSLALIVKNNRTAYEIAKKTLAYFDLELGKVKEQLIPLQVIIDSGTYLRGGRIFFDNFKVDWNNIKPGGVYVSRVIYNELSNSSHLHNSLPDNLKKGDFIELPAYEGKKGEDKRFLFQGSLIQGDHRPCFYCGDRRHLSSRCPSKNITEMTNSINNLGYFTLDDLNNIFFNYLNSHDPESVPLIPNDSAQIVDNSKNQGAKLAFYELKSIYQIVFFRTIWDLNTEDWNKIKSARDGRNRGGLLWIGVDCIRVSNIEQAESILVGQLKNDPEDYKIFCAMGFLMIEKNDYHHAKKYFKKALEFTKTIPQKIFILFLISRIYDLNGDDNKARDMIRKIIRISPYCHEALYQDILFRFRKGDKSVSLHQLNKLIKINRDYYVIALIDPELANFNEIINPILKQLFAEANNKVGRIIPLAKDAFEKLRKVLGEGEKEVLEAKSLLEKMTQLSETQSYFGLLDMIHYGETIINMGERSINIRRKKVSKMIFDLEEGLKKCESHVELLNYQCLTQSVSLQIKKLKGNLDRNWDTIESCDSREYKKILSHFENMISDLERIKSKLEKLDSTVHIFRFAGQFLKNSLFIQSANLIIALIVFPIIVHYLNFILPDINVIPRDIWHYQKMVVALGGLTGLILASLMTKAEPSSK